MFHKKVALNAIMVSDVTIAYTDITIAAANVFRIQRIPLIVVDSIAVTSLRSLTMLSYSIVIAAKIVKNMKVIKLCACQNLGEPENVKNIFFYSSALICIMLLND